MTQALPDRVVGEVRAELARRRMTQAQLAELIGRSEFYVSRRIGTSAKTSLDLPDLEDIARALNVSVGHFLKDPASAA